MLFVLARALCFAFASGRLGGVHASTLEGAMGLPCRCPMMKSYVFTFSCPSAQLLLKNAGKPPTLPDGGHEIPCTALTPPSWEHKSPCPPPQTHRVGHAQPRVGWEASTPLSQLSVKTQAKHKTTLQGKQQVSGQCQGISTLQTNAHEIPPRHPEPTQSNQMEVDAGRCGAAARPVWVSIKRSLALGCRGAPRLVSLAAGVVVVTNEARPTTSNAPTARRPLLENRRGRHGSGGRPSLRRLEISEGPRLGHPIRTIRSEIASEAVRSHPAIYLLLLPCPTHTST